MSVKRTIHRGETSQKLLAGNLPRIRFVRLFSALLAAVCLPAESGENYIPALEKIFSIQERVADIHRALATPYPVAVVADKTFFVYAPVAGEKTFGLAATAPDPYHTQTGMRAAMPLAFWENRAACVVTPEIFAEEDGYVFILHEFVHCYQWENGELALKEKLRLFRQAMEKQDYMWELQHPFPYDNATVARTYRDWCRALELGDAKKAEALRSFLKKGLNSLDWEYMAWEEWKEGLARYLENRVRERLRLPLNLPSADASFDRVSFYRGGDLFIAFLLKREPALADDLAKLFGRILYSGG